MSDRDATHSDLVEIAKQNGDFRKNYGVIVGAFLYLRSISAARPRLFWWQALMKYGVLMLVARPKRFELLSSTALLRAIAACRVTAPARLKPLPCRSAAATPCWLIANPR